MNAARRGSSPPPLASATDDRPGATARLLSQILERGSRVQAPAVQAYVQRLRRAYPDASPAEIITKLEKRYLTAVTASGAAVGSTAAVPGIGTFAALSAATGETVVFLEAAAVFVLAIADVHGVPLHHRERRRALVLAVLVGDDSKRAIADLVGPGRIRGAWLTESALSVPLPALSQLNHRLLRYFLRRYALKRGTLLLGKTLPMGVGALIGGGGNRVMGKKIVANARKAFGPPRSRWPVTLHVLTSAGSAD